ncbi:MAG: hypothetical protein V1874_12770 [Spirochaetota bacterium]
MKKFIALLAVFAVMAGLSCKKQKIITEPEIVLQRWAKAIEQNDYHNYSRCEANPKSEVVFREMFRDDYYADLKVVELEEPDKSDIQKDFSGNEYIHRTLVFDGTVVKRGKGTSFQNVRGDIMFIKYLDGKKGKDGWLIWNRTIMRVNK